MTDRTVLLPLRVPSHTPLETELERWLQYIHLSAAGTAEAESEEMAVLPLAEECREELERLGKQRKAVRNLLLKGYAETAARKEVLITYAKLLSAFAGQGFAAVLRKECKKKYLRRPELNNDASLIETASKSHEDEEVPKVTLGWVTDEDIMEDVMLWEWEQANVWWTLAVLEVYHAQQSSLTAKSSPAWKRTMGHYITAASWMAYLQQEYFGATPLSNQQPTQYLWSVGHALSWEGLQITQAIWTATAQRTGIAVFNQSLLKGKLSAAAALLYEDCRKLLKENDDPYWKAWLQAIEVWIPYCQAVSQSQQAMAHITRREFTDAYQRYQLAVELAAECESLLAFMPMSGSPHEVAILLETSMPEWKNKCSEILEETPSVGTTTFDRASLAQIPPQKVTKVDLKSVTKVVESTVDTAEPPLFANLLSPEMRSQVQSFSAQMETLLSTTVRRAEEKAEAGRRALSIHNLPHALAAYQLEVGGCTVGGLPDEVWEKIEALQQSNKMNMLQQELWELKDMADMTQQTFKKITDLLDDDLETDRKFRLTHPDYAGHNVEAVQTKYRQALQNYQALMETASKSDAQLLQRLEDLPTDTKFKMLSKSKAQLDCLLPATAPRGRKQHMVDVTPLNQALAALSVLFNERDELVQELTTAVRKFNLMEFVQEVSTGGPDQATTALQGIFQSAQESLQDMVQDIQQNMLKQTDLVKKALDENVKFVKAREEQEKNRNNTAALGNSMNTNRTLVLIHQAIEEVEELAKYLDEGKAFYNVVLPKLRRLSQNVEDLSTRLTITRCEYEEKEQMTRQEAEDARFAESVADGPSVPDLPSIRPGHSSATESNMPNEVAGDSGVAVGIPDDDEGFGYLDGGLARRPTADIEEAGRWETTHRPGVDVVPHDSPDVRLDDAKVAHLIAMDFDPDKVVAALKKHDNNIEQALNELLIE